jgi:hypothetical protein
VEGIWGREEYGRDLGRFLVGEDALLYRVFTETQIWSVVPKFSRGAVLKVVYGSKVVRHWGALRTAARLQRQFL